MSYFLKYVLTAALVMASNQLFAAGTTTPASTATSTTATNVLVTNTATKPVPVQITGPMVVTATAPIPISASASAPIAVMAVSPLPISGIGGSTLQVNVSNVAPLAVNIANGQPLQVTVTNPSAGSGVVTVNNAASNPVPVAVISSGTPPPVWRYVGQSANSILPIGILNMHAACSSTYPASRMCSISEMVENSSDVPPGLSGANLKWVREERAATVVQFVQLFVEKTLGHVMSQYQPNDQRYISQGNCANWSSSDRYAIYEMSTVVDDSGSFQQQLCRTPAPVACCMLK